MPYLTLTEYLKLQLSPGLVASCDIQPRNGVGLLSHANNSTVSCDKYSETILILCGPEVLFETCVAMKYVDDDDDDSHKHT